MKNHTPGSNISLNFKIISYYLTLSMINPAFSFAKSSLPAKPASANIEGLPELPAYPIISAIESNYIHDIEPIFARKCFSCHTPNHRKSWYFKIPILNKLINRNFDRALKALDLSVGFPFIGAKSIQQTLKDLEYSTHQGSMPPPWWTAFFWHASLTESEKNLIHQWVQDGLKQAKLDK